MPESFASAPGQVVRQLTSLDAQFLAIEDARNFTHVGGVAVVDPSTAPGGKLDLADVHDLIEQRLHMLPPFRWKLQGVPLGLDHPYWINDPDFDIEFHVRELALPAPGDDAQLATQVERLFARPLDRSRPLWEVYVIQGLEGGRVALVSKIHHSVLDGVSGAEILGSLYDLEPSGRELPPKPDPDENGGPPSPAGLVARGAIRTPGRVLGAIRHIPKTIPNLDEVAVLRAVPGVATIGRISDRTHLSDHRDPDGHVLERPHGRAPRTSLNGPVSAQRRFSFGSISLDAVKRVKDAYGVKVNDVVVSLSAGALREFLISHDDLPDEPLVSMIPVSVRTEEEMGTYGNKLSAMVVQIPTDEPDPVERLRRANAELSQAKDYFAGLPNDLLVEVNDMIPPVLYARTAKVTTTLGASSRFQPHFNAVISNVPGPPVPLYIAGARLESNYPLSVIMDGVGLNITVLSYRHSLDFGIIGDRDLSPAGFDSLMDTVRSDLAALEQRAATQTG
ncbi:MAG: wax ester/triacylglycerol synthase family O-acyltransferase [Solirubrobacterales bacterium]|nr:wax ester/triacylglycerol synthase family O-acyltransferase [Solirubrobacterales bacterium]